MQKTQEMLSGLVAYEKLAPIPALNPPTISKLDVPLYIKCPNFEKASSKFDQKMERVKKKIASIEQDLAEQQQTITRANRETTHIFGPPKDPSAIAKHNQWVARGQAAAAKAETLVEKHNEATEEAKEQLDQLRREAEAVIDDDIVATLHKIDQIARKLESSPSASDDMAAIEVCFLGMKIHAFFVELIEGNAARKEAREAQAGIAKLLASLCGGGEARNHITDTYQRNLYLVQSNSEAYQQLQSLLSTRVNQANLRDRTTRLSALVGRKIAFMFDYAQVVDPSELETINGSIRKAILDIDAHCAQIEQQVAESADVAREAVAVQKAAEALLGQLKAGVTGLQGRIIGPTNFLCEIVDQETIDDFFAKDIKPAVAELRQHLVDTLGEAELDQILTDADDVHFLGRAEKAIADAALMKLESVRGQAPAAITSARAMKKRLEDDLIQIREVPKQNAERFSADVGTKYMLSLLPLVGVFVASSTLGRITAFKSGFTSTNDIYRDLAAKTIEKNRKFVIANAVIGGCLGLVALVASIMAAVGTPSEAVSAGAGAPAGGSLVVAVGGLGAAAYLLTALILFVAGRRLGGYTSASGPAADLSGTA